MDLRLPAAVLAGLGAPWNTLGLHGALRLQSPALSAQREQGQVLFNGTATLEAKDMSSRLSPLRPLGDYRVELSGGAPARVQLRTLGEAALLLEGVGQWNGTRLVLRGQAKAGAGHEESLSNLLNIIGRRQGPAALITLG